MKTETINYSAGPVKSEGVLVYDETVKSPRPALLMAPSWLSIRPLSIERAQFLAGLGYVVFMADMYGAGVRPKHPGEAAPLANALRGDAAESRRRIRAAYDTMVAEGNKRGIITDKRVAVGFCFGGGNVLELARDGVDFAAAVSIHGDLKTTQPAGKGDIKAAMLVLHGAPDPVVPKADRDAFEAEMEAAGAKWEMVVFSGIVHAYTDDETPVPGVAKYDEPASRQSYAIMQAFIADAFAGKL